MTPTPNDLNHQVALYGQDPMDEFPVLKAFQAYLNEEQAKARKRLIAQAFIFGIIILALAGFFMFRLTSLSGRNQQLTDRLIEYALKDRSEQTQREVELKSMTDSLAHLQQQIKEERSAAQEARKAQADAERRAEVAKQPDPESESLKARIAEQDQQLALLQKQIKDQKAIIAEEEAAKKAAQAENVRIQKEQELEAYRRKHYPELYRDIAPAAPAQQSKARATAAKPAAPTAPAQTTQVTFSQADVDEILREVGEMKEDEEEEEKEKEMMPAISYFNDEGDDYEAPVKVQGKSSKWSVPLK